MKAGDTCPYCGGVLAEIVYGMPSSETVDELREGAPLVLAGCEVPLDPPAFRCRACGLEVGEWAG